MTVSSTLARVDTATNGVTTLFTVPFRFLADADILVTLTLTATGVQTPLALTADYTVSGAGASTGGSISTVVVWPAGYNVTIVRNIAATQLTDYIANDPFPAESHEAALDKLTMLLQQALETVGRTLTIPVGSTATGVLPIAVALNYLRWNAAATAIENAPSGVSWYNGAGAPASNLGVVGDFYINNTNSSYYKKTDTTTWTVQGSFQGIQGPSGSVTDGDKGDVTVSAGGTVWVIDPAAVTFAKMANLTAQYRLIGRTGAGAGPPQELATSANVFTMLGSATNAAILANIGAVGLASPAFTGNPTGPTPAAGDTSTSLATTAFSRTPSVQSLASSATVTPTFSNDAVKITAQAVNLTLANPTGTAIDMAGLVIRIKDNGVARTITYGVQYRAMGVTLPVTTVISKTVYLGMIYNNTDTKWDVVSVAQEP